jgi:uncharacterized protein with von Willebrand factor type A (vWA) domain
MSEEDNDRKLVLLTDFIEQRTRKDNEIKYYEEQLKDIERRLFFLRKEHDLTTTIIDIITREKIYDVKEELEKKMMDGNNPLLIKPKNTDIDNEKT